MKSPALLHSRAFTTASACRFLVYGQWLRDREASTSRKPGGTASNEESVCVTIADLKRPLVHAPADPFIWNSFKVALSKEKEMKLARRIVLLKAPSKILLD